MKETTTSELVFKLVSPIVGIKYKNFCGITFVNATEANCTDKTLTSKVFANITFKKKLAKEIVKACLNPNGNYDFNLEDLRRSIDTRLRCLISYYWAVESLKSDRTPEEIPFYEKDYPIVRTTPGDNFFNGYRCFVVNMLCFTADKFILGFRANGGPMPYPMKYYKGCRPGGVREAKDGSKWTLILFDRALSDDNTAIFSNDLDGEGTIEMCDWLSDSNQRLIYRQDF